MTSFLRHIRWRVVVRRLAIALLGLFIAMLGLFVSLFLFILLFMGPETGRLSFNELPLIDDLPVAHSSSECVYWHFDSARGNHVDAFGRLEEKQTLPDLFRSWQTSKAIPAQMHCMGGFQLRYLRRSVIRRPSVRKIAIGAHPLKARSIRRDGMRSVPLNLLNRERFTLIMVIRTEGAWPRNAAQP